MSRSHWDTRPKSSIDGCCVATISEACGGACPEPSRGVDAHVTGRLDGAERIDDHNQVAELGRGASNLDQRGGLAAAAFAEDANGEGVVGCTGRGCGDVGNTATRKTDLVAVGLCEEPRATQSPQTLASVVRDQRHRRSVDLISSISPSSTSRNCLCADSS
jgi:hypothetical protein